MFKNLVKEYLNEHGKTLDTLKEELGISYRIFHAKNGDLVILSYSQIDSPKTNPIVRMCRGLVLEMNTWDIVSYPFYRFYNFEEVPEERLKFNWKNAMATEKIDGSLLEVFNYKGEWLISTRSMIGGENAVNALGTTVNDIFDMAISPMTREEFFERLSPTITYIFEIVSPFNQIVTQWDAAHLYLIGGRDYTNQEYKFMDLYDSFDSAMRNIIRIPKVISLYDKEADDFVGFEKMKMLAETGNSQDEGFVVVDFSSLDETTNSFPRVKVKNSAYVALHHLRGSLENGTPQYERILTLIYNKEDAEVLANLPHMKPYFDEVKEKFNKFLEEFNSNLKLIETELNDPQKFIDHPELKKEFAMKIKDSKYKNLFFFMLKSFTKTFDQLVEYQIGKSVDIFDKLWEGYISKM